MEHDNTALLITVVVISVIIFAYWLTIAAMFDWFTTRARVVTQSPAGYELECVNDPDQPMICYAYCGEENKHTKRPHP